MAMTATISCSPSAVMINQQVTATITVANSGSSTVTVQGIRLSAKYTGDGNAPHTAVAYGTANLSAGATTTVAPSGSTVFPMDLKFFAPSTGLLSDGNGTFDVIPYITCSDGSYISASAALVSVDQITFAASQQ